MIEKYNRINPFSSVVFQIVKKFLKLHFISKRIDETDDSSVSVCVIFLKLIFLANLLPKEAQDFL